MHLIFIYSAFAGITPAVKVDVALLVTARGLRSMGGRGKVIFTDANRLHAYIQHSSRQLSVQGKLLSCTAGWFGVKSVCLSFFFFWDISGWAAFIQGFHFSLEAGDWLSRPSSSVPGCCEMELLSRSLKIFLSLPRTTPGVRSLEMAESSQKPLENYGAAAVRCGGGWGSQHK